jgi:hypothetical protein
MKTDTDLIQELSKVNESLHKLSLKIVLFQNNLQIINRQVKEIVRRIKIEDVDNNEIQGP